ncbi:MAG: extracellular solute-binding protein, partial [Clostridia bacterium]
VGLIYNTKIVTEKPDSWSIMWDQKYANNILMFNNPRDAFGIPQFMLGLDVNSEDKNTWQKAYDELLKQKPLIKAYVMDEVFNKMESGAAAMAPYYAGDFLSMYQNNPDLAFVYPKEGTNIFIDSICIPKGSKNKAAAELYINFLLDPNVALQNAEMICYTTPNTEVKNNQEYKDFLKELSDDAYEIMYPDLSKLYPNVSLNNYYFHNLSDETLTHMNDLWTGLKIAPIDEESSNMIFIICGAALVVIVLVFIFAKVRKKMRDNA